jgi:hypothetical protein
VTLSREGEKEEGGRRSLFYTGKCGCEVWSVAPWVISVEAVDCVATFGDEYAALSADRERDHLYWYIISYVAPTIGTDRQ